jgi:hypothetical protein
MKGEPSHPDPYHHHDDSLSFVSFFRTLPCFAKRQADVSLDSFVRDSMSVRRLILCRFSNLIAFWRGTKRRTQILVSVSDTSLVGALSGTTMDLVC